MEPIEVDDPKFDRGPPRLSRNAHHQLRPHDSAPRSPQPHRARGYRGHAFSPVPVVYASPGRVPSPIGVINPHGPDGKKTPFTPGDRKLVAAIGNQIGAANRGMPPAVEAPTWARQRCAASWSWRMTCSSKLLPVAAWVGDEGRMSRRRLPGRQSRWLATFITC